MADPKSKSVLVTGANGYVGNAVARAFVRAGWTTYGLVRKASAASSLAADEIIPILGSPADPSFLDQLNKGRVIFHVIVSTTEQIFDYIPHYNDIVTLLQTIARTSNASGVRPLVIFTSGCKDYGMQSTLSDSPDLAPHTEESPLNPPAIVVNRANYATKIFEHVDLFDAIVTRPTHVFGLASSYYGNFFKRAAAAAQKGVPLDFTEDPRTVLHATHVDDCAEAYVMLAGHSHRDVVKGQCYNISGWRYETLDEIAKALVREYEITDGVRYLPSKEGPGGSPAETLGRMLTGFSQWIGSEKLRADVGWRDRRQLFTEGIHQYRLAYDVGIIS